MAEVIDGRRRKRKAVAGGCVKAGRKISGWWLVIGGWLTAGRKTSGLWLVTGG